MFCIAVQQISFILLLQIRNSFSVARKKMLILNLFLDTETKSLIVDSKII